MLGHAEVGGIQDAHPAFDVVPQIGQQVQEVPEPLVPRKPRDVLHQNGLRVQFADEPLELLDELVPVVNHSSVAVESRHGREALARWAPGQEIELTLFQPKSLAYPSTREVPDVEFPYILDFGMVQPVRLDREWVDLYRA